MEEMKKILKVCIYAVGILCLLGFAISILGEKLSADVMTVVVFFFTGYGIVAFIKKVKDKES